MKSSNEKSKESNSSAANSNVDITVSAHTVIILSPETPIALATQASIVHDTWYLDSISESYITNTSVNYTVTSAVAPGSSVLGGTGFAIVESKGTVKLRIDTPNGPGFLMLSDVLYAPQYSTNVITASKLIDRGYNIDLRRCRILLNYVHKASFRREGSMWWVADARS